MKSSAVVIDANIAIFQVIEGPVSAKVEKCWSDWIDEDRNICAPRLWLNEITSVLHKIVSLNSIDKDHATEALEKLLGLGVELYTEDADSCRRAFTWASLMNQRQAYDGFYLALAEQLQAEFWTADRRMANTTRNLGVEWVHWVGE